ncbi:hypothetical protein LPJ59_004180 [Coemansia sp. RSA 2399]|nr:hypothetical protein LPJ59_004180 [Coemansia sp. RSA 2399]KAJ1900691.1 hypothetical protein LPJ81_003895 [Coemansia sp. IMI 209127]
MLAYLHRTRVALSQFQQARSLLTSRVVRSDTKEQDADKNTRPASSAPHGTVLKGLNIYKEGKDPIALKDEEYPEWLWAIMDVVPRDKMSERERQRQDRSKAIKESNFMKSKKK